MKRMPFRIWVLAGLLSAGAGLFAQAIPAGTVVVATSSWTAAFVKAAGFTGRLHVLAPANSQHPPEYELRPSDIQIVASADIIVFAGYERMVGQLKEAVAKKNAAMLQIQTDYSLATLRESLVRLAGEFGTQSAAEARLLGFASLYADMKNDLKKAGVLGSGIICHAMQAPFLKELGFSIKAVFGPAPLEPRQLGNLSGGSPTLIIDNWHNRIAGPLKDLYPRTPLAVLINFPGQGGTESLADVLEYNRRELLRALRE